MKVGDYVRTKNGKIVKCFKSESMNKPIYYVIGSATNSYIEYQDIIKSSPNIIDLIEVGDYVNGSKVIKIEEYNDEKYIYVEELEFCNACNEDENVYYKEDTINSILTKEQFSSMKYKVGK